MISRQIMLNGSLQNIMGGGEVNWINLAQDKDKR